MKNLKSILSDKRFFIHLITLLKFIAIILCLLSTYFLYHRFNKFLVNMFLLVIVIIITLYNLKIGIIIGIIFFVMFILLNNKREGFTWTDKSEKDFISIQKTILPGMVFDTKMIQETQASQQELNYFIENGVWPWSEKVIQLYVEAVDKNPYIRTYKNGDINYVRTIYNQSAILRLLSMQTKEGQFLANGVLKKNILGNPNETLPSGYGDFGYNSRLVEHLDNDIIKCKSDNSGLERIHYTGKEGIFGEQTKQITDINNNDLEKIVPGFSFINGSCNPCGALKEKPDYSCPFNIKVKGYSTNITDIWKYIWNIND